MKPDFQLYTLEEAKAKGLPYEKQEERVCEHCGKPLEWLGIISKDGFVRWVTVKDCDCKGRRDQIKRQEEAKERLREERAGTVAARPSRKTLHLGVRRIQAGEQGGCGVVPLRERGRRFEPCCSRVH